MMGRVARTSGIAFSRQIRNPMYAGPCGFASGGRGDWQERDDVLAFARQSPIYHKCFSEQNPANLPSAQEWVDKGLFLRDKLSVGQATPINSNFGIRIFHFYLPLYFWLRYLVRCRRGQDLPTGTQNNSEPLCSQPRTIVIGLNAPQGAGKTTLVNLCRSLFSLDGLSCVALSIDDFYLTNDDQQRLAAQHSGNRLLEHRGNAGTHDVALGRDTIIQCVQAGEGGKVALPRYDKSLGAGRGDRAHRQQWPVVEGRIDVVLLEGWMLGFRPLPPDAPQLQKEAGLAQVNANLGEYEQWHALVDAWAVIQVEDLSVIASWRLEAERRMRRERGAEGGMTDAQVRDFVSRFMPSYTAFSEHSIYNEDELSRKKPVLRILFDKERNPTG